MIRAFDALGAGLQDVFGARLGGLAALCFVFALTFTVAAAWAGIRVVLPMIPDDLLRFDLFGVEGDVSTIAAWAAGFGIVALSIVLAPAVSMIVGGALFDVAAARVEKAIEATPGRMVPIGEGLANGFRIGLPALGLNLIAIPFYFVPLINLVVFFWLNGFLMGREYFALAAVRHMSWDEAKQMRRRAPLSFFLIGLVCSFIPFVAPLVGASAMTRLVAGLRAAPSRA